MASSDTPAAVRWYYRPVWVLVLLFAVLGPFGLPYLWKSPRFSRAMQIGLTACVLAYTGLLIGETIRIVHAVQHEIETLDMHVDP